MTEQDNKPESTSAPDVARPVVKSRRQARVSWIWLVPLIAAIVGASLLFRDWLHAGPTVTISFESADGLEVGQTKVRYKEVVIGTVTGIKVSKDRKNALVSAEIDRESADYIARSGSRFWVVRPRLGFTGVTGLNTLISGAYISVDTAETPENEDEAVYEFKGLEQPPEISSSRPGTRFTLRAVDLGSLEIGSPVYFRRIQVGQIIGYSLDQSGRAVNVQVFVDAPYDKFVTEDARFWNASGINLSLDADGFKVETGSFVSIVAGGIAFESAGPDDTEPAKANSRFRLAGTREAAMADPDGPPFVIALHFLQSVRGLKVGAPVDFRGLELGKVSNVNVDYDNDSGHFFARVEVELYPLRFGRLYDRAARGTEGGRTAAIRLLGPMIDKGLRAQIRPANLLTGQQYVALDFFPKSDPVPFDPETEPLVVPTIAGNFDQLQQQISSIVNKFDQIPFADIGVELRDSLEALNKVFDRIEGELAPQATSMLKSAQKSLESVNHLLGQDSTMTNNLEGTMKELSNAARSLRALADYLQTHPSSVVRGRAQDPAFITP
ncbi:intermembrane transport protein PqiB [Allopusillimonas ginsengisoli]|uniref:PqiB family protein n=1 Tax=Allopusillimonas ginsengisoli TaxID=453575 RepID=UPI00101F6430|nr:MlaD family protein [Allopusillimonas ginsengisoli]TEA78061.1 MCE family protein [Allopusillimonas ginsengisoli]